MLGHLGGPDGASDELDVAAREAEERFALGAVGEVREFVSSDTEDGVLASGGPADGGVVENEGPRQTVSQRRPQISLEKKKKIRKATREANDSSASTHMVKKNFPSRFHQEVLSRTVAGRPGTGAIKSLCTK